MSELGHLVADSYRIALCERLVSDQDRARCRHVAKETKNGESPKDTDQDSGTGILAGIVDEVKSIHRFDAQSSQKTLQSIWTEPVHRWVAGVIDQLRRDGQ